MQRFISFLRARSTVFLLTCAISACSTIHGTTDATFVGQLPGSIAADMVYVVMEDGTVAGHANVREDGTFVVGAAWDYTVCTVRSLRCIVGSDPDVHVVAMDVDRNAIVAQAPVIESAFRFPLVRRVELQACQKEAWFERPVVHPRSAAIRTADGPVFWADCPYNRYLLRRDSNLARTIGAERMARFPDRIEYFHEIEVHRDDLKFPGQSQPWPPPYRILVPFRPLIVEYGGTLRRWDLNAVYTQNSLVLPPVLPTQELLPVVCSATSGCPHGDRGALSIRVTWDGANPLARRVVIEINSHPAARIDSSSLDLLSAATANHLRSAVRRLAERHDQPVRFDMEPDMDFERYYIDIDTLVRDAVASRAP